MFDFLQSEVLKIWNKVEFSNQNSTVFKPSQPRLNDDSKACKQDVF